MHAFTHTPQPLYVAITGESRGKSITWTQACIERIPLLRERQFSTVSRLCQWVRLLTETEYILLCARGYDMFALIPNWTHFRWNYAQTDFGFIAGALCRKIALGYFAGSKGNR